MQSKPPSDSYDLLPSHSCDSTSTDTNTPSRWKVATLAFLAFAIPALFFSALLASVLHPSQVPFQIDFATTLFVGLIAGFMKELVDGLYDCMLVSLDQDLSEKNRALAKGRSFSQDHINSAFHRAVLCLQCRRPKGLR